MKTQHPVRLFHLSAVCKVFSGLLIVLYPFSTVGIQAKASVQSLLLEDTYVYLPFILTPDPCHVWSTVTDSVSDVTPSYIDVTSFSSALSGHVLTGIFTLRRLPATLTFNRAGVRQNALEYAWEVYIDVDNNPATGEPNYPYKGAEYALSATAWAGGLPQDLPIKNGVQANTWKYDSASGAWGYVEVATMRVDTQSGILKLVGLISGITSNSRLMFYTFDFNPGGNPQSDVSICSLK